jgi:rhomboid protease GluP
MAEPVDSREAPLRVELRRMPFVTPELRSLLTLVAVADLLIAYQVRSSPHDLAWALGLGAGAAVLLVLLRLVQRPRVMAPIELYRDHATLPLGASSRRREVVPYRDFRSILLRGTIQRAHLLLGAEKRLFVFPADVFARGDGAAIVAAQIRSGIAREPDGDRLLEEIDARDDVAAQATQRRPLATRILLFAVVGYFVVELLTGALDSELGILRLGANAPSLVAAGQWFRLVSANFLHGGLLHLYVNGIALFSLGTLMEWILGPACFLTVYLVSGVAAAGASALVHRAPLSVGASGAIFGLLGALAAIHIRFRSDLPAGFRQSSLWWIVILALNGSLPIIVRQIDGTAHAGGFVVGLLLTLAMVGRGTLDLDAPWRRRARLPAALAVLFTLAGLGQAAAHARTPHPADEVKVLDALAHAGGVTPAFLNEFAWVIAVEPVPSPEQLALARDAAARAVAAERHHTYVDTLATVEYRLNHLDAAVTLERSLVDGADANRTYATQLGRFLAAKVKQSGAPADADAVRIRPAPPADGEPRPGYSVELTRDFPRGAVIYALERDNWSHVVGLGRLQLGPGHARRLRFDAASDEPSSEKDGPPDLEARFEVLLVDGSGCACEPAWKRWPSDPEVTALP